MPFKPGQCGNPKGRPKGSGHGRALVLAELDAMLSITRAWRLVKFFDNGMLAMTKCSRCGGHFVTHRHEIAKHFVCGLCAPPARAGKGKAAGAIQVH